MYQLFLENENNPSNLLLTLCHTEEWPFIPAFWFAVTLPVQPMSVLYLLVFCSKGLLWPAIALFTVLLSSSKHSAREIWFSSLIFMFISIFSNNFCSTHHLGSCKDAHTLSSLSLRRSCEIGQYHVTVFYKSCGEWSTIKLNDFLNITR